MVLLRVSRLHKMSKLPLYLGGSCARFTDVHLCGRFLGILRGAGLATLAARANIAAYYFFGIPIGFVLAFKLEWGLKGLWTGHIFALCLNSAINTWFVHK